VSYSNTRARLGTGSSNLAESAEYPLVRISNNYMLLLSLYRGSWISRKVVDVLAEDMLKHMPRLNCEMPPEAIDKFDRVVKRTATQGKLLEALKWGRLFGGAVALMVIDGVEDLSAPLDFDEILPGKYRGLIVLDRWSGVYPDSQLVTDINNPAEFGQPMFYRCDLEENGRSVMVHHSRLLRFIGRDLPSWEKQVQLYWGMSELELVFDELRKRDYTDWNIVSLISRAQIMVLKEPELAPMLSGLGANQKMLEQYVARIEAMSGSMSNQGILALGKDGSLENKQFSFSGLEGVLNLFLLNISGASEIPVSRLFGRTITGLGQSGEGDLQIYYDAADQKRQRELGPQIDKLYRVIAASTWGEVPDDLDYAFPPIRTMTDKDRSDLAKANGETIIGAFNAGLIGRQTALKELKQLSETTEIFSNITDEMIEAASDDVEPGDVPMKAGQGEDPLMRGELPAAKDSAFAA